jgi:predicted transcriptional regulator of viral defense system
LRYCAIPSATQNYRNLYRIASEQDGYFTTKQAIKAGYETNSHSYHLKTGNWIKEHRCIYRLANFPIGDRPDLMLWYLWSRNRNEEPQGVYSHETPLAIHDLTDLNPSKLHMTVPRNFRRNSRIPDVLVLHYNDISPAEIDQAYGVKITNTVRTIIDIVMDGYLSEDLIIQAIKEAMSRGAISKKALEKARQTNGTFNDFTNY